MVTVGAGSAGAVVANRLSENSDFQVLLLEAGGDETRFTDTPAFSLSLIGTEIDWNYTVDSSSKYCLGARGKTCIYPRGKILGGSSAMNGMTYVRGNKRDYDEWAEMGNYGWSFEDVLPYFKKSEDNRNLTFPKDKRFHSTNGELTVFRYI
ncbi:Dehydrogenase patE [Armadillidium nasatum]|uniref:Dehydrogenase patE n=1 Tax=Armadillidium nasatum TaxID=96803 RepID=A0A5N5SJ97_9CRUS|nr:Dehydrogenase patE [Armadillidium nasatum]